MIKKVLKTFYKPTLYKQFCTQIQPAQKYSEKYTKARCSTPLYDLRPQIQEGVFVAPNASVIGQVYIGEKVSILHGAVLRGDINAIFIQSDAVIGQNCVLHTAGSLPTGLPADLVIERNVVIQAGCTLYSCVIKKNAFIGYNSVVMEGAIVQSGAIVAANSVVPPGRIVPQNQMWGGNPIKFIREAHERENFITRTIAQQTFVLTQQYTYQFLPYSNAYLLGGNQQTYEFTIQDVPDESYGSLEKQYDPTRLH